MVQQQEPTGRQRRSGATLDAALLAAAWDELVQVGYGRLTMATIAARAGTSEPVLYRRWPNKDRLVLAALEARRDAYPIGVPDTGSLRTDLIAQLLMLGEAMADFYAVAAAASLSGLLADTGKTPAQVREQIMGTTAVTSVRGVYQRAALRGELDLDRVSPTALEMPFDLLRHDLLMHLQAPAEERVRAIVDELFLPLIRPS